MNDIVIGTGGGVILDKENVKALKKNFKIVFLECDLDILQKRLENSKTKRPNLTKNQSLKDEIEEVWKKRKDRYLNNADMVFNVSNDNNIEKKAEKIIMNL